MNKQDRSGMSRWLRNHPSQSSIIICEPHWIYIKIPKVAGTSIMRGFLEKKHKVIHLKDNPDEFRRWLNGISDDELERYFVFTFVRNPWGRAASASAYFRDNGIGEYFRSPDFSFESLVANWHDVRLNHPAFAGHTISQHMHTHFCGRRMVDYVGRFENLRKDFATVCDVIDCKGYLPWLNQSSSNAYNYSSTSRATIGRLYRRDVELFEYAFPEVMA